jgi:hypothetical protein
MPHEEEIPPWGDLIEPRKSWIDSRIQSLAPQLKCIVNLVLVYRNRRTREAWR